MSVFGFVIPNLDEAPATESDYRSEAEVLRTLSTYMEKKASAIELRKGGQIEQALWKEEDCERLYNQLPEWARW